MVTTVGALNSRRDVETVAALKEAILEVVVVLQEEEEVEETAILLTK